MTLQELARHMSVAPEHLQFMLESVANNIRHTNAEHHFVNDEQARDMLTKAYVQDFQVRMRDMCHTLLTNEQAKADFRDVVYSLVNKKG